MKPIIQMALKRLFFVIFILLFTSPAYAGWLSGYAYRKQMTITGSTAGAQTNYQMKLLVDESSGSSVVTTFTTSGTWVVPAGVTSVEILVVAGGGGGGANYAGGGGVGGGGGAGGVIYNSNYSVTPGASLTVTVGAGGAGGAAGGDPPNPGADGGNSVFNDQTAIGGGGGGAYTVNAKNGGSGGGAGYSGSTKGTGTAGQGNNGADPLGGGVGGGGGGKGGVGSGATGGAGQAYTISGSSVTYATGGNSSTASGNGVVPPARSANTGDGGFGGWNAAGAAGGSGVVILKYAPNVDCNGHVASDFDDLRFTTSDGTTLLDYWIESITGTTPNQVATVWVEFDSIPASPSTADFYMYYSNASASAGSNRANTFIRTIGGDSAQPLKAAWSLNDTANNVGGTSGVNGTLVGSPSYVAGKWDNCLNFNGSSQYVTVTTASPMRQSSKITYEFWAYTGATGYQTMGVGVSGGNGYGGISLSNSSFYFTWTPTTPQSDTSVYNSSLGLTSGWHHFVFSFDFTTGTRSLYVDNVSKALSISQSVSNYTPVSSYSSGYTDAFGARFINTWYYYTDKLDEIRIYDDILTSAEIADLYNNYGYTTSNFSGRVLVRKRVSPEPSFGSWGSEATAPTAPTVTTSDCTDVSTTSATGNGNITATGGENCTTRGFCYMTGTSGDPTTSDSTAYDTGSFGTGAYTKSITGLTAATNYRVRAYAINSAGTSYGTTVQLTTTATPSPIQVIIKNAIINNAIIAQKSATGTACSSGSECLSGNCIDGYCCNTTCTATCQACNVSGSEGTCTNIPADTDPGSECGTTGCLTGNCNGSGACGYYTSGDGNCPTCQTCVGATSGSCLNYAAYNEDTGCNSACTGCSGGSCVNIPNASQDTWGSNTCTATHYRCNGDGSCTAPCSSVATCVLISGAGECNPGCAGAGYCGCQYGYGGPPSPPNCTGEAQYCTAFFSSDHYCSCYGWLY